MKFYALPEIVEKGKTRALTAGASSSRSGRGNLDSEIREIFSIREIWNPGLWNPEYSSKNLEPY